VLRWLLTRAAEAPKLAELTGRSATVRRLVGRWIAGETLEDGLRASRELAATGAELTLDHVGEFVGSMVEAEAAAQVYEDLLGRIGEEGLAAGISVKPTQLGMLLDERGAVQLVEKLASRAHDAGVHVTLDMEDHTVVEATVRLVERVQAAGYANVGCAVQSYLHRTAEDVRRLTAAGASLRLCKGAYDEPAHLAYQRRVDVDRSYLEAARYLLAAGHHPRFATHDHRLVAAIQRTAARLGRDRDTYEFQMLYGVRPEMQQALLGAGYRVRIYVPFGSQWYPYFTRRLAERPANLLFFLRMLSDRHPAGPTA
jgi:proline dehydrogenase